MTQPAISYAIPSLGQLQLAISTLTTSTSTSIAFVRPMLTHRDDPSRQGTGHARGIEDPRATRRRRTCGIELQRRRSHSHIDDVGDDHNATRLLVLGLLTCRPHQAARLGSHTCRPGTGEQTGVEASGYEAAGQAIKRSGDGMYCSQPTGNSARAMAQRCDAHRLQTQAEQARRPRSASNGTGGSVW